MTVTEKISRLILSQTTGIGPVKFLAVLENFGSASDFLKGDTTKLYKQFVSNTISGLDWCYEFDTNRYLAYGESGYPSALYNMPDPPIVIFVKGDTELLSDPFKISIVGTRKCTSYGAEATKKITKDLVRCGFTTVSGLAYGVDTVVHSATIAAGGKTIAVMGTPVDKVYPAGNRALYNSIAEGGLVMSEIHEEALSGAHMFPRRNRIIAALSEATLVTEAPAKSGALITAELAFDYNRLVFAIPASIFSRNSQGCHNLIASNKAKLVCDANDILHEMNIPALESNSQKALDLDQAAATIFYNICSTPQNFDELLESVRMPASQLQEKLLHLEMNGLVAKTGTGAYTVKVEQNI